MKHGAQCISKQLHDTHCADRAVWIGADYTTPGSSELLSSGIPVFIYKVFRKAADLDAGDDDESIRELFGQAEKCGATVGSLQARPGTQQIEVIPKGTRQLLQSGGINLGSVSTDPMNFSKHSVGLTQTGIDLQHWPAACKLQEQIAANQTTFEIVAVVPQIGTPGTTEQMTKFESSDVRKRVVVQGYSVKGTVRFVGAHAEDGTACVGVELDDAVGKNNGTVKGHVYFKCEAKKGVLTNPSRVSLDDSESSYNECRAVAFHAFKSFAAVSDNFDLLVYRDATTRGKEPLVLDIDQIIKTHGDKSVFLWIDSRTELPIAQLQKQLDAAKKTCSLPWVILLTCLSKIDGITSAFGNSSSKFKLSPAVGTLVNECSEDLITIRPKDAASRVGILDVAKPAQVFKVISQALKEDGTAEQYVQQLLVGDRNSVIVRGMAPNTQFLFELRNNLLDGQLERRLNQQVAKITAGHEWVLDKAAFAGIYQRILSQMDQLTPHQQEKLSECIETPRSHVSGPAGCGKTFIALHLVLRLFDHGSGELPESILFIGKNEALCIFFVSWIVQRLRKTKPLEDVQMLVSKHVRVLHSSPFNTSGYDIQFDSENNLSVVPAKSREDLAPSFVIIDEAHHIFEEGGHDGDCAMATRICETSKRSLLLSDISQGTTSEKVLFPPGHVSVMLKEVVRNSSRVVAASLPFCRSDELTDVKCQHGVRGPPLVPFIFDNCGGNDHLRFAKYSEGVLNGIGYIFSEFPGAELHDQLVILVPDITFLSKLQPVLEAGMQSKFPEASFEVADAVVGAFPVISRHRKGRTRIVLDTLQSFDGMERLFVFSVGLDSKQTAAGCSGIYRAITRAHMFVCVVQEHIEGGWLEFTAKVELDEAVDFDADEEAGRVKRDNLEIIENGPEDLAADVEAALAAAADAAKLRKSGKASAVGAVAERVDDDGFEDGFGFPGDEYNEEEDEAEVEDVAEVELGKDPGVEDLSPLKQNVWQANTNSNFRSQVSSSAFTPFKLQPELGAGDDIRGDIIVSTSVKDQVWENDDINLGGDVSTAAKKGTKKGGVQRVELGMGGSGAQSIYVQDPAMDTPAVGPQDSFVLSNVFAGCPLQVNCAASWTCNPKDGGPKCLYILVGAATGLYILETSGEKRELVQVSKRICTWLHIMDDEGMMISVSGMGLVCVHDLHTLLGGEHEPIKFKTTKLLEGATGGMCAVTKTKDTGFTYLCAAVSRNLVLMQWYAPRKKFMKLKDFETPFEEPPAMMELCVLKDEPLPVVCVGCTRDKATRSKKLAIINPNWPPDKVGKHMSAELGWVRTRAGREDTGAHTVKQIGPDAFMVCFSNVASFLTYEGVPCLEAGRKSKEKIVFETPPETCVHTPGAVIGFWKHRMERRSIRTGKITHQMTESGESIRVVGKEGNIIIETRAGTKPTSHLYLLVNKSGP